jgi:hypothetical protein
MDRVAVPGQRAMVILVAGWACFALCAGSAPGAPSFVAQNLKFAPPPQYDVDLGRPTVSASRPEYNGLNLYGDLAGSGFKTDQSAYDKPYFYNSATGKKANLGDTLGDFADLHYSSKGTGINDLGWVVGKSHVSGEFNSADDRPFLWIDEDGNGARNMTPTDEMRQLDLNPDAASGYCLDVNNAGQVAITGNGVWRARYQHVGGVLTEVGQRIQLQAASTSAFAMNESGDVAYTTGDYGMVWRDLDANGLVDDGETTTIPSMSGFFPRTRATDINNVGQVVGTMKNDMGGDVGFLWTDLNGDNVVDWDDDNENGLLELAEESDEIVRFMGDDSPLGSSAHTYTWGLNDAGQVVGGVVPWVAGDRYAFYWSNDDGPSDLNALVSPEFDIAMRQAHEINNRGQIAAYGRLKSGGTNEYLALLTPIVPGDGNGDAAVTDADYTIWADNYGATGADASIGDYNGDGIVTDGDYTVWADNYGFGAGQVPEPTTLLLIPLGRLLLRRRPRRVRQDRWERTT